MRNQSIPHFAFHIPHSTFHIPHSTFHIQQSLRSILEFVVQPVVGVSSLRPLRLGEYSRLNKEAHRSQRRKGAAIYFSKTISLSALTSHYGQTNGL